MKNCNAYDRIYYKNCYNCQKSGSHTSGECPTKIPQLADMAVENIGRRSGN